MDIDIRALVAEVVAGARNANPIRIRTSPRTNAMPATPKATTEVNNRGLQERRVHRGRADRVLRVELGVGLAARDFLGVFVDDVGLTVRRDRAVHPVARRAVGVVRRP